MQSFIMTVGLPASGKSTWAKKYANEHPDVVIISSDEIRASLGDVNDQSRNSEVFEEMRWRTNEALKAGKSVIWDATNITSKRRIGVLKQLPKNIFIYKICILFPVPVQECKNRNKNRKHRVPEEVIDKMYHKWQTPWQFEGWNDLWLDKSFLSTYSKDEFMRDVSGFDQKNPHHAETLKEHSLRTMKLCQADNYILKVAGLLHDYGKLETQVFVDPKGNPTEEAHYYYHENIGAYKSLFYDGYYVSAFAMVHVSALITWHMLPFSWKTTEDRGKAKRKFGEKFYNDLMELHHADIAASLEAQDE